MTVPMTPRSPHEAHRVATPLELFFDLVFVVAIARAAAGLHHAIAEQHAAAGVLSFAMVFFAIWWAWMNFTWFASAYDCDDVWYRLAVLVQMTGALILAAGVPDMFVGDHRSVTIVVGYAVMRLALVAQWLRAAAADPGHRTTTRRYAFGIATLQVYWVALLWIPNAWLPGFVVGVALELAVPAWAERAAMTPWHPHHIAERYGLFTIIVLGESILAATIAVQAAIASGDPLRSLVPIIVGGLLIVFSMWWIYFDRPAHGLLTSLRKAIVWGYGHYFVFASVAAVGAGLAAAVDQATHHAKISSTAAGFAIAIPVALYLVCLWVLHYRKEYWRTRWLGPIAGLAILATPFTSQPVLSVGLILAVLVTIKIVVAPPHGAHG